MRGITSPIPRRSRSWRTKDESYYAPSRTRTGRRTTSQASATRTATSSASCRTPRGSVTPRLAPTRAWGFCVPFWWGQASEHPGDIQLLGALGLRVRPHPGADGTGAELPGALAVLRDVERTLRVQELAPAPRPLPERGGEGLAGTGREAGGDRGGGRVGARVQDGEPQPSFWGRALRGGGDGGGWDHSRHPGHGRAACGTARLAAVRAVG